MTKEVTDGFSSGNIGAKVHWKAAAAAHATQVIRNLAEASLRAAPLRGRGVPELAGQQECGEHEHAEQRPERRRDNGRHGTPTMA